MLTKKDIVKINEYLWEVPKSFRSDMKVPARIYASEKMLDKIFEDRSLEQLVNLATLPGVEKQVMAMPDVHEGYGSPIGGVFATRVEDGIISPGAVGYDENCGVRFLYSNFCHDEIKDKLEALATEIQRTVPSGLGRGHRAKLSSGQLDQILAGGAQAIVNGGYGEKSDLENCEANGRLEWADISCVSETAKNRGRDQVGTLGSGNHFLEIQKVDKIFSAEGGDKNAAEVFGLFENQVVVMIHTGSRGLGHQIATDYIRLMVQVMPKYKIILPDRELACAPFKSPEGQRFFKAMACGANFAWANRQMITYYIRQAWKKILGSDKLDVLYDVAHNIAKLEPRNYAEQYAEPRGKNQDMLIVHRKGATRAFPPGHPEVPEKYRTIGQPVIIPGSMGTASYILHGTKEGKESFYSACHGAGRRMSRHQAIKSFGGENIIKNLEEKGIIVKSYSMRGIAEEAPLAYKDIDDVVEVVHQAGLSKKVARLVPLAVIKGE
jgi:tRNA-splicing ligase RtcB